MNQASPPSLQTASRFDYVRIPKHLVPCPACGGKSFQTLCRTDRYLMGVETSRCAHCGLVMTNPMPTDEALGEFYKKHYRKYYRKLERPDVSYIQRYALHRRAIYTVKFLAAQGLLGHENGQGAGTRVLDVGCGEGSILREIRLQKEKCQAYGVEVYEPFARFTEEYAGCPTYRDLRDVPRSPGELFDLVILSHVLEHILEPVDFLKQLAELLRPGGKIFIDVPDVCRYHWLADLHLAHVYHFSPRTLAAVCRAADLEVAASETHHPPKLPGCVRMVAGKKNEVKSPQTAWPQGEDQERQAALRISRMHRWARFFSFGFRLTMAAYEWSWTVIAQLPSKRRHRSLMRMPVEPWAQAGGK
ncbi:MAG: class I SAM-dependent methyltransferase [Phycisphaeraceae bacterium]|nr:class I SAM-dependent methyltransferase [Phycisphaeraceae bacterium]